MGYLNIKKEENIILVINFSRSQILLLDNNNSINFYITFEEKTLLNKLNLIVKTKIKKLEKVIIIGMTKSNTLNSQVLSFVFGIKQVEKELKIESY